MKTKLPLLLLCIGAVALMIALNSCTLTVSPDGSRTYGTDPKAVEVILDGK